MLKRDPTSILHWTGSGLDQHWSFNLCFFFLFFLRQYKNQKEDGLTLGYFSTCGTRRVVGYTLPAPQVTQLTLPLQAHVGALCNFGKGV